MNPNLKTKFVVGGIGAFVLVASLVLCGYYWGYRSSSGMRITQDEIQHYESVIKRLKDSQHSELGDREKVILTLRHERDSLEKEIVRLKQTVEEKDAKILRVYVLGGIFGVIWFLLGPIVGWIGKNDLKKQEGRTQEVPDNA